MTVKDVSTDADRIYRYMTLEKEDHDDLDALAKSEDPKKTLRERLERADPQKNRLLYLFGKKSLYCTTPEHFNDPHDCLVEFSPKVSHSGLLICLRNFSGSNPPVIDTQKLTKGLSADGKKRLPEYLKGTRQSVSPEDLEHICTAVKDALQQVVHRSRIACFSKRDNSSAMWAHYADKHRGFCLEFNVKTLRQKTQGFYDMTYCEDRPVLTLTPDEASDLSLAMKILLRKGPEWTTEQEVRHINGIDHGPDGLNNYLKFNPEALSGVILGAKMCNLKKRGFTYLVKNTIGTAVVCNAGIDSKQYRVTVTPAYDGS